MARFPQAESDITKLAVLIINGLTEAPEEFAQAPVPVDQLQQRLDVYTDTLKSAVMAQSTAREQYAAKDEALEDLVDGMKANLKYAEVVMRDDPERLNRLGWGPRRTGSTLELPGEVRDIAVLGEGEGWLVLDWKQPADGGVVAAYTIQRRRRPDGGWEDIGTAVETETALTGQERGVEFEYRVVAVNKQGRGKPSGVVVAVL